MPRWIPGRRRVALLAILVALLPVAGPSPPAHAGPPGCHEVVSGPSESAGEVTGRSTAYYCHGVRSVRIVTCLHKARWWGLQTIACSHGGWTPADAYSTRPASADCGRRGDRYRWVVRGVYHYDRDGDHRADRVEEHWGAMRELTCSA